MFYLTCLMFLLAGHNVLSATTRGASWVVAQRGGGSRGAGDSDGGGGSHGVGGSRGAGGSRGIGGF
jgi:hypothetical protein